jgi:hypothetical protein
LRRRIDGWPVRRLAGHLGILSTKRDWLVNKQIQITVQIALTKANHQKVVESS